MTFNKNACVIRKLYCGDGKLPKDTTTKKYSRKGTSYECLKKGFGIADWEHRKKDLPKTSLQQILYIGPTYEANFRRKKIYSTKSLVEKTRGLIVKDKRDLISSACSKKGGTVDYKAFNSVVLFLHDQGLKDLPGCRMVKE